MVVVAAFFAFEVVTAGLALTAAKGQAQRFQEQLRAGDVAAARTTAADLRDDADRAHGRTDGPLWWAAARLPVVGETFGAVRTAAAGLDLLAHDALPAATEVAGALQRGAFRPRHGAVALGPVERLQPGVRRAAAALDTAHAELAGIDPADVLSPVRSTYAHLQQQVAGASSAADAASTAVSLLPAMLGADGPRSYLLMVQNNAEIRATGGMAGSWAVLHADHGRVRMGLQGADTDMPALPHRLVPVPKVVRDLYGSDMGTDFRDMNFDPHFPDVARMAVSMLRHDHHVRVDGVVSVDPVALAHVLDGTGPVPVHFRGRRTTLTGGNVVEVLLNRVYRTIDDGQLQNDFFNAAARAVFHGVTRGHGDPRQVTEGVVTAADRGRILVWSRHPDEQRALAGTRVSGALPDGSGEAPQVGVYLGDATATKMEYYLRVRSQVRSLACSPAGVQTVRSRVVLRSTAPQDAARLSPYITGPGTYAPLGTMRLNAWLYGPTGGRIVSVLRDGHTVTVTSDRQRDRQVTPVSVLLHPGEQVVISTTMRSGPDQHGAPVLTSTPTAEEAPNRATAATSCGD